jgi:hypothetical protein
VKCRLCAGYGSDSQAAQMDHLRMNHPLEVDVEDLPSVKHYTDPTYEKARQIVKQWKEGR